MVGHGSFNGDTFIRLVIVNAGNNKEDILEFFKILERFVLENKENIKKG
jgi:sulfinoalanine decarboxylase/sulfinoalanine decarboxylase/aspartate 1-decarboxylase